MPENNDTITIVAKPERRRFEVQDNAEPIGKTQYVDHDGRRVFFHTDVDEAYAGRGLASDLVRTALDTTLAEGLVPVGVCPYVHAWLERHPDVKAKASEPTDPDFAALRPRG
ncbi:GNAT family N-acetyltransferase [Galactobacter caseinivorans]|uniref:N-acetyltransferase n=1 Tax=Galactobacter caseinivorans TaxID=2676123 RepID=A0A496PIM8_9MICC|nr:GNAT family N-acetyltransferase [Galactobacter caseinivorans]RKW70317.1 N-acetyltransferase [Galactobacter caseinivorans]